MCFFVSFYVIPIKDSRYNIFVLFLYMYLRVANNTFSLLTGPAHVDKKHETGRNKKI